MLAQFLQPGAHEPAVTVSPRLTNKEPFRPTPRVLIPQRPKSEESTSTFIATAYQEHYPVASGSGQAPILRRLVTASSESTSSAPSSPIADRRPLGLAAPVTPSDPPAKSLRLCRSTVNLRPTSPLKVPAPFISRPIASQPAAPNSARGPASARPMTPSAPPVFSSAATSSATRPTSPIKVRAKVTDGISPRKKPVKGPPPKPNIVKRDLPQQGLGISLSSPSHRPIPYSDATYDLSGDASFSSLPALEADHSRESDTVTVHLRLRPLPSDEPSAWIASPSTSSIALQSALAFGRSSGVGNHNFDAVHVGSSNDALYNSLARPLVSSVLSGFNALIFAYGQTASGKTFTLSGDDKSGAEGITQMAVKDLFRGIRRSKREREWLVRCSWIEVYNEAVKDLLDPSNIPQIRSSVAKGTFVSPLAEIIVTSPAAIFNLLEQGQQHRHVNATDWNERSSRSHTAFKIIIESWARDESASAVLSDDDSPRPASPTKGKKVRVSELVLVDLAGSEKYVTKGGQERRAEGANINKSLLTLGKVIFALSEKSPNSSASTQQQSQHIPYRDSKLTRILQNSLSGNSKIAVVATLNQTVGSIEESLSTIMFAKRIKKVQLSAQMNEVDAPESSGEAQALLIKYKREADDLRRLVRELQDRDRTRDTADATVTDVAGAATQQYIQQVEERLKVLGSCVVRGEGLEDLGDADDDLSERRASGQDEMNAKKPLLRGSMPHQGERPATPSHLDFTVSTAALRQQLHAATRRITSLEARRDSSVEASEQPKDDLIAKLQHQLLEAEIALEATALQPLPKVREDVEAEYLPRIAQLEKELKESRELNEECVRECERLHKVNRRLVALAHKETSELVGRLKEEASSPVKGRITPTAASATPVTAGGGENPSTPTIRRLKDGTQRERPKSVLGDMGMRNDGNRPRSGGGGGGDDVCASGAEGLTTATKRSGSLICSPPSFAHLSPLRHKASSRTLQAESGKQRDRPPTAKVTSVAASGGRRSSASHDFSIGAASGAGGSATVRKRTYLCTTAAGDLGGGGRGGAGDSDEENADESALLDF